MTEARIHPLSDVQSSSIGANTRIWQFVVVLPDARIGADCNICSHCFIENDVIVGDRVTVKCGVQLWDGVRLHDDVFIGPNVSFTNDRYPRSRGYPDRFVPTVVKRGASIGAGAVLLAGITVGENAMVAAGAVVTRDVEPDMLVAGVPARPVRKIVESVIPFLDLRGAYLELKEEIDAAVARVMDSGWYIGGEEVEAFEREFAAYSEARHCVGGRQRARRPGTGPDRAGHRPGRRGDRALQHLYRDLARGERRRRRPVPVEPDPATHNIDPQRIEAAITPRTRALLPVHLYGQPADLDPILAIAGRHGLALVEDAAQAHGARYRGRRIGAHGDIVCWSFYPGKNLGALGDGGAVTTDRSDLADRIRVLRNYGSSAEVCERGPWHEQPSGPDPGGGPPGEAGPSRRVDRAPARHRRALSARRLPTRADLPAVPDVGRSRLAPLRRAEHGA